MKKLMLLAAFLCACGPREEAATDSATMTAAAAPAGLTAAELTGTWSGTTMAEGSDSVLNRFTVISATGMDSKTIIEGSKDTIQVTHTIDADSVVATSAPYTDPSAPVKQPVTFRAVGRMVGGKLVGTTTLTLASKPDSVVARGRFELTKTG